MQTIFLRSYTMNYIGNFSSWIEEEWTNEILSNEGTARPKGGKRPDSLEEELEYTKARAAGYKDNETYFYMFTKDNTSFDISPPFVDGQFHWWITKMLPGNFMPMHVDPHTRYERNSKRFWMPLQDWRPGHIFMYENLVITDYKKGDTWWYDNPVALHGAANIGHTPRVVLQISTYD